MGRISSINIGMQVISYSENFINNIVLTVL